MADNIKTQIRCLISNVYDLQKMRISAGNRLVQSFYIKLGIEPSTSPDNADKEEKKMIDKLKNDYKRISDAISENNSSIKKAIKDINSSKDDKDVLSVVQDDMDYKLIESYMMLLKSEEDSIKVLDTYVKQHPLWEQFFEPIKGCGTLMSAVCIAYLDIYKARYVSSFYRYAGLDTVQDVDKDGNPLFKPADDSNRRLKRKLCYTYRCDGENYFGKVIKTGEFDAEGNEIITTDTGELLDVCEMSKTVDGWEVPVYEDIETGEEYEGNVLIAQHGRRKGDTEMFEYTTKDGEKATKRGITYNPILKTKLMGVLTGCLLKAKDPTYSTIYYDYRARLDNSPEHKDKKDGHKSMMAQRYMIKQFLRNLWTTWRTIEGLEVNYPYEVAKLGNKPHKYNQYQCEQADKWSKA